MTIADVREATPPRSTSAPGGRPIVRHLAGATSRLASLRLWVVNAVVFAVFAVVFFGTAAPFAVGRVEALCRQAPPDVRFTSSADAVMGFLTACGPAGRDAYRLLQVADLLYPTVFGMFLATSMALVISRLAPTRRALLGLAVLPLAGSAFDYLENICAWLALTAYPDPARAGSLLGLASAAKTLTFWTSGAVLLAALGMLVIARARQLRSRANGSDVDATARH